MRRIILTTLIFLALTSSASAANRYWVGGTASWDATAGTKWALTSGGAGGQAVPTSSDDCFFDATSGTVTVTIVTATANCLSLNFTGFTGTWAGSTAINIVGSLTLGTGMTRSYTGTIGFTGSATTYVITPNGKTTSSIINFTGTGTWLLQGALNNSTQTITQTAGTFNTNGFSVTSGTFSTTGATTRVLSFATSTVTVPAWTASGSNLTLNLSSSTIAWNGTGVSTFAGGGFSYGNLTITNTTTGAIAMQGANTFQSITYNGPANELQRLTFDSNLTVLGTFTATGNSIVNRPAMTSSSLGVPRTFSVATTTISNVDFQDITGTGTASWSMASSTGFGDCGGNSGIQFTSTSTLYWIGNTGSINVVTNWATSTGGASASKIPLCQDSIVFDNNSFNAGSQVVTFNRTRVSGNMDWSAYNEGQSPTMSLTTNAPSFYGSIILNSGMLFSNTGPQTTSLIGNSSSSLNFNGVSWSGQINITARTKTYTLTGQVTSASSIGMSSGFLDASTSNITAGSFTPLTGGTVSLGTGLWTATLGGTFWNNLGTTVVANTGTIKATSPLALATTFAGNGATYYNLLYDRGVSTTTNTITGSNTFNEFRDNGTVAHAINFTAGTTNTFAKFSVSGSMNNLITVTSATAANHNLVLTGSGVVNSKYLSISRSQASPANTWYAGTQSTDGGNNSGWIFNNITSRVKALSGRVRIQGGSVRIR